MQDLLPQSYSAYYERTTYTLGPSYTGVVATRAPILPVLQHDVEPHISLAAEVCEINSKVFPNLGSMTHSNTSGWLYGMQKTKNGEKGASSRSRYQLSYATRPETNLGSPKAPLVESRKQAVMDATASHTFVSANALPGQILVRIRRRLRVKFGNAHRRPKPNIRCLGSSGLPSMKRSGRKDSGSSYISGFLVIPLKDILKDLSQWRIGSKRKTVQTICLPLRENPREYDIQGIGHFESTYGEAL